MVLHVAWAWWVINISLADIHVEIHFVSKLCVSAQLAYPHIYLNLSCTSWPLRSLKRWKAIVLLVLLWIRRPGPLFQWAWIPRCRLWCSWNRNMYNLGTSPCVTGGCLKDSSLSCSARAFEFAHSVLKSKDNYPIHNSRNCYFILPDWTGQYLCMLRG